MQTSFADLHITMGAFIGYGHTGVWANNRERDAFLDWFAANRCEPNDARWEYCKSDKLKTAVHVVSLLAAQRAPRIYLHRLKRGHEG